MPVLAVQGHAAAPTAPAAPVVSTFLAGAVRGAGVGIEAKAIGGAVPAIGAGATRTSTAVVTALLAKA